MKGTAGMSRIAPARRHRPGWSRGVLAFLRVLTLTVTLLLTLGLPPAMPQPARAAALPDLVYKAHTAYIGWMGQVSSGGTAGTVGQARRLEALQMDSMALPITYRAHVATIGWMPWVTNVQPAGTTGLALAVEAVELQIGDPALAAQYDIVYRAHVANIGWLPWVANGATAGTTGQARQMEAFEALVTPKGGAIPVPAPGTDVSQFTSRQVMVASRVSGSTGTWARYQWDGATWQQVGGASSAAFGYNGTRPGSQRVEGDGTTPLGTYPMIFAFGEGNPGTAMPYSVIGGCTWWIGDHAQPDYNRWRDDCSVSGTTAAASEHMIDYVTSATGQYRQGAVIGFNYANPIRTGPGSGSGIFLHYTPAGGVTAGCVGLSNRSELAETLVWMDPASNPTIVIRNL